MLFAVCFSDSMNDSSCDETLPELIIEECSSKFLRSIHSYLLVDIVMDLIYNLVDYKVCTAQPNLNVNKLVCMSYIY